MSVGDVTDGMIEVVTFDRRGVLDWAYAPDAEAALTAGRTLRRDALDAHPVQGYRVTVGFYVEGKLVRQVEGTF